MKFTLKNQLQIRLAEADISDAVNLIHYVKDVADESQNLTFSSKEFKLSVEEESNVLLKYKSSRNSIYILAKYKDNIIGVLNFVSNSKNRIKHVGEFGMSVLKEYWNLGVGTSLLEFLITWAKANGVTEKIKLSVRTDNSPAIHLYKKYNFIIEGIHKNEFFIADEYFDTYSMALELEK